MTESTTVINDPVHGHIELQPLYMKIIDTPQFQRLRFLKQLGSNYLVFPGAVHTRFEHSIGVCHLAETLCKILQEKQPELKITDTDVQCVAIAGLCHDLGHGPFSHLFDKLFLPKLGIEWKHESGSVLMFQYLIKENKLESHFEPKDLVFIIEQILPPKPKKDGEWPYKGRSQDKSFLYEIVANKRNGIDVDKWDYIARDCYFLGIKTSFDHNRLMKFVRVLNVNGEKQICTRAKEVDNLYELFHSRMLLHRRAYLHKTSLVIDHMIFKALELANEYLELAENGVTKKISECIDYMPIFMKLDDNIFNVILWSSDPNLKPAREWLERIVMRKLPKFIGRFKFDEGKEWSEDSIKQRLCEASSNEVQLKEDDVLVILGSFILEDVISCIWFLSLNDYRDKRKIDYGMRRYNPIDSCSFYNKHNLTEPYKVRKEQVSSFLPIKFSDIQYLIFLDKSDPDKLSAIEKCYQEVCNNHKIEISMGPEQSGIQMTPMRQEMLQDKESPDKKRIKRSLEHSL